MNSNPWLIVPAADYEAHMAHDRVRQLQTLNEFTKERIAAYKPASIIFFGACTGNGFEHIEPDTTVYAVDINSSFLDLCSKRYSARLKNLKLVQVDITKEHIPLPKADLIICDLIFEYLELEKGALTISSFLKESGILSVVIQKSNNNSFVSDTGIRSLGTLSAISTEVPEEGLSRVMHENHLSIIHRKSCLLPNGKELIRFDYKNTFLTDNLKLA